MAPEIRRGHVTQINLTYVKVADDAHAPLADV